MWAMSNVCQKEFQGWCRAFTATEVILSILQAALLTVFVTFLTFIILHFWVCSEASNVKTFDTTVTPTTSEQLNSNPYSHLGFHADGDNDGAGITVAPGIACTWTPSAKTTAVTQYFEHADELLNASDASATSVITPPDNEKRSTESDDDTFIADHLDGEPAHDEKSFIIALVKMRPPDDVTFGCILTVVSKYWTLTAASCLESIEEVDSLDSFVMTEHFGEAGHGRTHQVSDVLIHPHYQGTNKTYDIVALKSEDKLTNSEILIKLPIMFDYLLITIGETLTILGFGKFRSKERDSRARSARTVSVHVLPSAQCENAWSSWSTKHLARAAPAARGPCGAGAVCAGPLRARATPCHYCAGTPLLRARVLLGVMSGPGPCGAACEPALYVNLAALRDWLNAVLRDD